MIAFASTARWVGRRAELSPQRGIVLQNLRETRGVQIDEAAASAAINGPMSAIEAASERKSD